MKILRPNPALRRAAFTLVEIMVSLAVLTILLLISAQVIGQVQSTWSASNARVSQFREARIAFDILSRNLSQATLNTYIDYDSNYLATAGSSSAASSSPANYIRRSELQFVCGPASSLVTATGGSSAELPGHAVFFQAPLGVTSTPAYAGLDRLMCARGYFVHFSSDSFWRPSFLPPGNEKYRYRLMEYSPPTELNTIYSAALQVAGNPAQAMPRNWFEARAGVSPRAAGQKEAGAAMLTRPVADNIVALIISPRREMRSAQEVEGASGPTQIAPSYFYDSSARDNIGYAPAPQGTQHLLPPLVKIVLVAIDERSADMLSQTSGGSTPPLSTMVSSSLTRAQNLDSEVDEIVRQLRQKRVNYRVFSATIQLRGSKWSI